MDVSQGRTGRIKDTSSNRPTWELSISLTSNFRLAGAATTSARGYAYCVAPDESFAGVRCCTMLRHAQASAKGFTLCLSSCLENFVNGAFPEPIAEHAQLNRLGSLGWSVAQSRLYSTVRDKLTILWLTNITLPIELGRRPNLEGGCWRSRVWPKSIGNSVWT